MHFLSIKHILLLSFLIFTLSFFVFGQTETKSQAEIERKIFDEINAVRKDPQTYLPYLQEYKKYLNGKVIQFPNAVGLETFEGAVAIDDAINFLKNATKLRPYKLSTGVSKPAKSQLSDLLEKPSLGHFGKDGSNLPKRLSKFGAYGYYYAENITYSATSPRDIVLMMIIDDGNLHRGHRKNLFSKNFQEVGIAYGISNDKRGISVTIFTDFFRESGSKGGLRRF